VVCCAKSEMKLMVEANDLSQGSTVHRRWIRQIPLVLASAGVGAGIMYVALHKNLSLGAHPSEEQFIGSKSEQSIIGTRTERDRACERFGQEHRRIVQV